MKRTALLALTIAASACFAQNLIVNGSFETGPAVTTLNIQTGNTTAIPGWEVIPGVGANPDRPSGRQSIDYEKLDWQAADGIACVELDGTTGPAGVRQVIPTLPGHRYQVRLFISAHPGRHRRSLLPPRQCRQTRR